MIKELKFCLDNDWDILEYYTKHKTCQNIHNGDIWFCQVSHNFPVLIKILSTVRILGFLFWRFFSLMPSCLAQMTALTVLETPITYVLNARYKQLVIETPDVFLGVLLQRCGSQSKLQLMDWSQGQFPGTSSVTDPSFRPARGLFLLMWYTEGIR